MRAAKLLVFLLLCGSFVGTVHAQSLLEQSIDLSGYVQIRYEYTMRPDTEDLSSFYVSRARLQFRGEALPGLTFMIMPEFARTASMRDAWVDYRVADQLNFRAGQMTVPFQFYRYVTQRAHHFAERGVPSENFGIPDGRDIGVMIHGLNRARTMQYQVGFFDGSGRNTQRSNSAGHLASARLSAAALGTVPREESDFARSASPNLAFGFGVQGATRNEIRTWDLGRSNMGNSRADWLTGTADANFQLGGFSLTADGFLRRVNPVDVEAYDGGGFTLSSGVFLTSELEIVGRFSDLKLDFDSGATRQRELAGGVNWYIRDHGIKTRLQYFAIEPPGRGFGSIGAMMLELQVSF
jgi:phosphate-selective porin OprO and OprP